jgi:two-component sensor histidine kinase
MRIADFLFEKSEARDWRPYVFAVAAAALAGLIQWILAPALDPFVIFLAAVSLTAFVGGAVPAILTAALGFAYLLAWPSHPGWRGLWPETAISFAAYVFFAAGQILLVRWFRTALARSRESDAKTTAELEEQKLRFQELLHRVGNHMQVVASILTLQKAKVRADPSSAVSVLDETRERVVNMSRAHRRLYDPATAGKSVQQHLQDLCTDFVASASHHRVVCSVASDASIADPLKLMTLSLLIGEAVNNSMKHAFEDDEVGTISVDLKKEGDLYVVRVRDNGRGLPPGFDPIAAPGLGFKIMQSLAGQLGGRFEVFDSAGVTVRVAFGA